MLQQQVEQQVEVQPEQQVEVPPHAPPQVYDAEPSEGEVEPVVSEVLLQVSLQVDEVIPAGDEAQLEVRLMNPRKAMQLENEQRSINRRIDSLEAKITDGLEGVTKYLEAVVQDVKVSPQMPMSLLAYGLEVRPEAGCCGSKNQGRKQ